MQTGREPEVAMSDSRHHPVLARRADLRALGLVEILVVCVILVALAAFLMPRYFGNSRTPAGKPASVMARAHDTECMANIRSVRQAVEVFKTSDPDGKNPQSLTELRELGPDFRQCPVGKVPYRYDPSTGEVHCPYPGHEQF